jgi:hypothetical protein
MTGNPGESSSVRLGAKLSRAASIRCRMPRSRSVNGQKRHVAHQIGPAKPSSQALRFHRENQGRDLLEPLAYDLEQILR